MREFRGPYTCCGPSRGMICRNRKEMSDGWHERIERLVLRTRRHVPLHRKFFKESRHLQCAEVLRPGTPEPGQKPAAPAEVGLLCSNRQAPGAHDCREPGEHVQMLADQRGKTPLTNPLRELLRRDRRVLPRRGRVLLLQSPRRIAPELQVQAIRPFCVNDAIQIPYSIDGLPELPRLEPPILPQAGEVVVHIVAGKPGQPAPQKRLNEVLRTQYVPAHGREFNALLQKQISVTLPENDAPRRRDSLSP